MIDVAKSRAEIAAMQGDLLIVPKAQMDQLFDEVELGQQARRVLSSIRTISTIAFAPVGAPT